MRYVTALATPFVHFSVSSVADLTRLTAPACPALAGAYIRKDCTIGLLFILGRFTCSNALSKDQINLRNNEPELKLVAKQLGLQVN